MATEAWLLEGASIGEGDQIANSLAARILLIQAGVMDPADLAAVKAVTDVIPDAGVMSSISDETDKIDAVKTVTDALPDAGALTGINDETDKIDSAAADGLAGVVDSLAYKVHEIEQHLHSYERWVETAATPNGEVHVADAIGSGNGAFQVDAGNDDWGAWVQVLGSSDTPIIAGSAKHDVHRIEVSSAERNTVYFFQLAFGASGAAALVAETYTDSVYKPASNQVDSGPVALQSKRIDTGTKAWARCMCPGQNTAQLSFFLGVHEYPG